MEPRGERFARLRWRRCLRQVKLMAAAPLRDDFHTLILSHGDAVNAEFTHLGVS